MQENSPCKYGQLGGGAAKGLACLSQPCRVIQQTLRERIGTELFNRVQSAERLNNSTLGLRIFFLFLAVFYLNSIAVSRRPNQASNYQFLKH